MQSSRISSKILESGWKWIENAPPGLRIGQNEPQDHDESNGTPPDPKYRSRKFKIPLKSEISEIQKCPLNLATNRMSNYGHFREYQQIRKMTWTPLNGADGPVM